MRFPAKKAAGSNPAGGTRWFRSSATVSGQLPNSYWLPLGRCLVGAWSHIGCCPNLPEIAPPRLRQPNADSPRSPHAKRAEGRTRRRLEAKADDNSLYRDVSEDRRQQNVDGDGKFRHRLGVRVALVDGLLRLFLDIVDDAFVLALRLVVYDGARLVDRRVHGAGVVRQQILQFVQQSHQIDPSWLVPRTLSSGRSIFQSVAYVGVHTGSPMGGSANRAFRPPTRWPQCPRLRGPVGVWSVDPRHGALPGALVRRHT